VDRTSATPTPTFFPSAVDFRRWLQKHHASSAFLWVGYYKKATGRPSIDWPESRDQALCFGWIDGIRKAVDEETFVIRFTPRRPGSIWSAINIGRVKALKRQGLMTAAGLRAFEERDPKKSQRYSFEQMKVEFSPAHLRTFKRHAKGWTFFTSQAPSYQKAATWWVVQAKKAETRDRRLKTLISDSSKGLRIAQMRPAVRKKNPVRRTGR